MFGFSKRILPKSCFISHAYEDKVALAALLGKLDRHCKPFIFPSIAVTPDEYVSDRLIAAIRKHPGLIYIKSDASDRSFWVVFERDYALRAGRKVFAFSPETGQFESVGRSVPQLPIYASYSHRDEKRVRAITTHMERKRNIRVYIDRDDLGGERDLAKQIRGLIKKAVAQGGYLVAFLSRESIKSAWVREEIRSAEDLMPGRVLMAWLDEPPGDLNDDVFIPKVAGLSISLAGHGPGFDRNRLDDLIVRLYWLIYRNGGATEFELHK